jgi:hypothetical protein
MDALVTEAVRDAESDLDDFAAPLGGGVGPVLVRGRELVFGPVVVPASGVALVDVVRVVGAVPRTFDGDGVRVPALEPASEAAEFRLPVLCEDVVDVHVHLVEPGVVHVGGVEQADAHLTRAPNRPEGVDGRLFDRIRVDCRHAHVTLSQRLGCSQNDNMYAFQCVCGSS